MKESIFEADTVYVANAMLSGGSFLASLAKALIRADSSNRMLILKTWEEDITRVWEFHHVERNQGVVFNG